MVKQFVGSSPTNCLSVSDYFVGLVLKGPTVSLIHFMTLVFFTPENIKKPTVFCFHEGIERDQLDEIG